MRGINLWQRQKTEMIFGFIHPGKLNEEITPNNSITNGIGHVNKLRLSNTFYEIQQAKQDCGCVRWLILCCGV